MPAFDFPNSPSVGDQVTVGTQVRQWNGTAWVLISAASIQGTAGIQGPAGAGLQGVQGFNGPQGVQGLNGLFAAQGIQGRSFIGVTSSTSLAVGTGSKTFTVSNTGAFGLGQRVRAANTAAPSNFMEGIITSITTDSSITINVDFIGGSGTLAAWTFSVGSGLQGTVGSVDMVAYFMLGGM